MKIYESGREASLLNDIINGAKTVECRLNKGKFAAYKPGDIVKIRKDIYEKGQLVSSVPDQLTVKIINVEHYPSFAEMFREVGFEKIVPRAKNFKDALVEPYKYYSKEDEAKFGVLAIYFEVV